MNRMLDIWMLDPFHAGSHASWSRGMMASLKREGHRVTLHTLPGRHWKWRMHGAAATWAPVMAEHAPPDVILTTDMCDVAQLRGLMPRAWSDVKIVTMFHENQLTFPWSPEDPDASNGRDNTYAYINLTSALASDKVWFNSEHHRQAFLAEVEPWMKRMPKPHLRGLGKLIESKSDVMPLGLDFHDWPRPQNPQPDVASIDVPVILWNHRWAWDKGTDAWIAFVHTVLERDLAAEFVVLGESFGRVPEGWENLRERMGSRCLHWGYVENQDDYIQWLWRATLAPIHPHQEYFGLSVVEAMRCQTIPWVPCEHAYQETMPDGHLYLPAETWADEICQKRWKSWPISLDRYEQKALEYSWPAQGSRASLSLLNLLS